MVLKPEVAGPGGFRNILVHGYLRLDLAIVSDALERAPADFSDFASAVRAWMAALSGEGGIAGKS